MSLITVAPPNGTISGPLPGSLPAALTAANTASGPTPAARSLLPSAVVASNLVPSYQQDARTVRTATPRTGPSSQLAAQYIAQTGTPSAEELALFAERAPVGQEKGQDAAPEENFLSALRNARNNSNGAPVAANNNQPAQQTTMAAAQAQAATPVSNTNILNFGGTATATAVAKPSVPSASRELPPLAATGLGRKAGLIQSRGASAYQLAELRNHDTGILSAGIDAIL